MNKYADHQAKVIADNLLDKRIKALHQFVTEMKHHHLTNELQSVIMKLKEH